MKNIKLEVEYDGTDFVGWQQQSNGRSVQGEIESVLSKITNQPCSLIGAGRTDSGVHAKGQVANFRSDTELSVEKLQHALHGLLPEDIVVKCVSEAPYEFHSRFSATAREYAYRITQVPVAIGRRYSWYVRCRLDAEMMNKAASSILGTHSFESFCKAGSEVVHYRCEVHRSEWEVRENDLRYHIRANRFLHGMVRSLVGTMVEVGRGYRDIQEFYSLCDKNDRENVGVTAPARGLTLEHVYYPGENLP